MAADDFETVKAVLMPFTLERCRGCSTSDTELAWTVLGVLRDERSLDNAVELTKEQAAVRDESCRYGAAKDEVMGNAVCRNLIACEFIPRPSFNDSDLEDTL